MNITYGNNVVDSQQNMSRMSGLRMFFLAKRIIVVTDNKDKLASVVMDYMKLCRLTYKNLSSL